jgi:hypothetical protein
MEHPIKLVAHVAVELCPDEPVGGREHVVVVGIARPRGVEEADSAFWHVKEGEKVEKRGTRNERKKK